MIPPNNGAEKKERLRVKSPPSNQPESYNCNGVVSNLPFLLDNAIVCVYYLAENNFIEFKFSVDPPLFVARKEELGKLADAMKQNNHAALVYGKRRVGKTRLIKEALKAQEKTAIYYECIKGTVKENVDAFVKVLWKSIFCPSLLPLTPFRTCSLS